MKPEEARKLKEIIDEMTDVKPETEESPSEVSQEPETESATEEKETQ